MLVVLRIVYILIVYLSKTKRHSFMSYLLIYRFRVTAQIVMKASTTLRLCVNRTKSKMFLRNVRRVAHAGDFAKRKKEKKRKR